MTFTAFQGGLIDILFMYLFVVGASAIWRGHVQVFRKLTWSWHLIFGFTSAMTTIAIGYWAVYLLDKYTFLTLL